MLYPRPWGVRSFVSSYRLRTSRSCWGPLMDEEVYQRIGQNVARYRQRRGLSQNVFAGLIGRSESWVSQVERGVHKIDRLSVLVAVARELGVEVADLVNEI